MAPHTGRSQLSVGAGLDMKQLAETPRGSAPPTRHPGRERSRQREPGLGGPEPGVCPGSAWGGGRCHRVLSAVLKVCSEKQDRLTRGFRRMALVLSGNTVRAGVVGDGLEWGRGSPGGPQASSTFCRMFGEVDVVLCHPTSLGSHRREGEVVVPARSCLRTWRLGAHQVCAQRVRFSSHSPRFYFNCCCCLSPQGHRSREFRMCLICGFIVLLPVFISIMSIQSSCVF